MVASAEKLKWEIYDRICDFQSAAWLQQFEPFEGVQSKIG